MTSYSQIVTMRVWYYYYTNVAVANALYYIVMGAGFRSKSMYDVNT